MTELNHIYHLTPNIIFSMNKIFYKTFTVLNSFKKGNIIDLSYI